jgi:peptidoglycan/LPS O-acetylase OafA/YrhL
MDVTGAYQPNYKTRQSSVDSFRGLAALSVVLAHFQCGIEFAGLPSTQYVHDKIGPLLLYLFRGTSVYFMVITGFILAMKLPQWKRHPDGLAVRAIQRMTKIVAVYWVALTVIMMINLIRHALTGHTWVKPTLLEGLSQYLFFSNFLH